MPTTLSDYYEDLTKNGCRVFLVGDARNLFMEYDHGFHDHSRVRVRGYVLVRPKLAYAQIPVMLKANMSNISAGTDSVSGMLCTIRDASLLMALDAYHHSNDTTALTKRVMVKLTVTDQATPEHAYVYLGDEITRHRSHQIANGQWSSDPRARG